MDAAQRTLRFEAVALPHIDSAFNLARWLARNDQDAEDIVQEAYLRAFKFFDGFHGDDGRPWLLSIVRNTFYSWYQQRKTQGQSVEYDEQLHGVAPSGSGSPQPDEADPQQLLMREDSRRQLNRALQTLPAEFREVLVLRELEDLSYKQIAAIAGIPMGTVMSRLARARTQLAQILASEGSDE